MAGQETQVAPLLVARPGSEKAVWAHELIWRAGMTGRQIVWIDPKGTSR